jgi:GrpB-like predicted nucleotidyltransferase (UPF0157 family)
MMGLPSGQVSIEDYTGEWVKVFEEERDRLVAAVGLLAVAIEHVGSTSIPGLCAKPVIDIAIGVTDLLTGKECIGPLSALGYEYKGDAGIPGRHFFAKGNPDDRTHYVHVEPLNGVLWRNHILFRDYLRCHLDEAVTYGKLKRALAEKFSEDRDAYALGKNDYIESIIKTASQEYELDDSGRSRPMNRKNS